MTPADHPLVAELKQQAQQQTEKPPPTPTDQTKPHPRQQATDDAGNELFAFLTDWRQRFNLTGAEYLYILQQIQTLHLRGVIMGERS